MMELKVPIGIAEAEDLAVWLGVVEEHLNGMSAEMPEGDPLRDDLRFCAAEAREWARVVKPVPIKRRG